MPILFIGDFKEAKPGGRISNFFSQLEPEIAQSLEAPSRFGEQGSSERATNKTAPGVANRYFRQECEG